MKNSIVTGCDENGVFTIRTRFMYFVLFSFLSLAVSAQAQRCTATTKSGEPCKGMAQTGTTFCVFHNPANRCEGTNAKGAKCGAMKMKGSKFCRFHQK